MHKVNFDVRLNKQPIKCEAFTLEDYIKFLIAKTSADTTLIKQWMTDILKTNTEYTNNIKHECELLIVNLITKSTNQDEVIKEYVCECGHEFDVKIDPAKIYINYNDCEIENLYNFQNFKLSLRYPELFDDDNIPQMIVKAIEYIYVGDDKIPIDDLSERELDDLFTAITPTDMENIRNILLKPKLQLDVPIVCPKCGKTHVDTTEGFSNLVRILK